MRVLNLVMAVLDIPTQIFLGIYCIWALITTIVSRMILNVREAELGILHDLDDYSSSSTSKTSKTSEHSEQMQEGPMVLY